MFRSRPLQVVLLLTLGITAVNAKEPNDGNVGAGWKTCKEYVQAVKDKDRDVHAETLAFMALSWVQGYFTARNVDGNLRVGNTLSSMTLEAMLVDQCSEDVAQPVPILVVVEALYQKLKAKGL